MGLRSFVTYCGLAGGMALIAGAVSSACADSVDNDGSGNPLAPPVACTQIGCENGLNVELRPASGWPAGEYQFQIQADGVAVTCRGSLPLANCSAPRNVTCDIEGLVQVVESGCALPANAQAFPGLRFDAKLRPSKLAISITRDGRLVGEADIVPSFQTVQPNGPVCPPTCDVAHAVLDVHF
ncbi:MAG: hypothetical protein ACRD1X_10505 [Vicinamibacteria bacterium]